MASDILRCLIVFLNVTVRNYKPNFKVSRKQLVVVLTQKSSPVCHDSRKKLPAVRTNSKLCTQPLQLMSAKCTKGLGNKRRRRTKSELVGGALKENAMKEWSPHLPSVPVQTRWEWTAGSLFWAAWCWFAVKLRFLHCYTSFIFSCTFSNLEIALTAAVSGSVQVHLLSITPRFIKRSFEWDYQHTRPLNRWTWPSLNKAKDKRKNATMSTSSLTACSFLTWK